MTTNNVMIDLETMGTGAHSAIVALGAVRFDIGGISDTFYEIVDLESCQDAGMDIDASTVMWWLKQSDVARRELLSKQQPVGAVLHRFAAWLPKECNVWGNGATFDNVILRNAYAAVHAVSAPWSHRNDMCYRTIKNLYPDIAMNDYHPSVVKHKAIDDATVQTEHLLNIARTVGIPL